MFLFRFLKNSVRFTWRMIDSGRRFALNLLFLIIVIFMVSGLFSGNSKKLEEKTALVLDLRGNLVEQQNATARELLMMSAQGDRKDVTQIRDVISAIDAAAKDSKITSIVLVLDQLQNAGLPMLREIAASLDNFKASGKKVIAWGSRYNQRQYYLAAHANQVLLHPMGMVGLEGLGGYRNYYRDALDKLGITVNVMRVGTYKSFAEPYIANGPSQAASEAESYLYNDLWATYLRDVEKARQLEAGSITATINDFTQLLKQNQGDLAQLALKLKWVDGLKTRDQLRDLMLDVGAKDTQHSSFRQIQYEDYLAIKKVDNVLAPKNIGVIVAEGDISDGVAPSGSIGGISTSNLIRKAREDANIKAVVLRVNSPGGSAFGSELIRRELELTRSAGKPVIISMGNVAASGGYWISMSADQVFADEATITGSIGVFAILPTADKALEKIGVHSGGTTTTWLRGGYDPTRPIDPRYAELVQLSVNHIYAEFTTKAAAARKTTPEKIDEFAQGRVWTGKQAKERGLIDSLGSFNDAVKAAATKAKLGEKYSVDFIENEPTGLDRLFKYFDLSVAKVVSNQIDKHIAATGLPPTATQEALRDMAWLAGVAERKEAFSVVTHCMCGAP